MEFSSFIYTDFVILTENNALINLATDFTTTYTAIDDKNFKLKLKPNAGVYFISTTFCAETKP